MDSYETVAIFAANEFPPPCGGGLGWGQQTTARQVWNFCRVALQVMVWKEVYCGADVQGGHHCAGGAEIRQVA